MYYIDERCNKETHVVGKELLVSSLLRYRIVYY